MRETLYLRLQSVQPEAPTHYCISGSATNSWPVQVAPLREVLERAADRRLIVLVPGADVRLLRINVAARSAAKILQAAPYALEDQLADDVEDLHFALGARQADGSHLIAAVSRSTLEGWMAPLQAAQLRPEQLIPELLCLPAQEGQWCALAEDGQISVRTGSGGFVCAPEDLEAMLSLSSGEQKTPLRLIVPRGHAGDFTRLDWPVELLPGHGSALEALLQNMATTQPLNLLQGDYSQSQGVRKAWLPWRPAAALALGWLAITALSHAVQAYSAGRELKQQAEANEQRFRSLFPQETRIVNLAVQLDQQAAALRGHSQDQSFLKLTETLARALAATPGLTLQGLQFRDGALYANLTGTDLQQPEHLQTWFAQNPDTAYERQSLNSGTEGVQLRIKLGGGRT